MSDSTKFFETFRLSSRTFSMGKRFLRMISWENSFDNAGGARSIEKKTVSLRFIFHRSGKISVPFWLIVFPFSYHVSGCAFLTYYSRDSAISAQNALHEKRTLPGVSVYAFRTQFTYFRASSTPAKRLVFTASYITLSKRVCKVFAKFDL